MQSFLRRNWGLIPVGFVVIAVLWFIIGFWQDSDDRLWKWFTQVFLERYFFPGGLNPMHFSWLTWLVLVFVAGFLAYMARGMYKAFFGLMAAASAILTIVVFCYHINDHSASYAGGTTFYVKDAKKTPRSLKRLVDNTTEVGKDPTGDRKGCVLYANKGMRGCIGQGDFHFEWDARTASATGAELVIRRSGGSVSNTKLLGDTLTYIYDSKDDAGAWTAIRDGKNTQPVYGISWWSGEGNVQTCTFSGQYSMNKSFNGNWGKNLADLIAAKYPHLFYDSDDRYGYCAGEKSDNPTIVIPVKTQQVYNTRTTFRAAGVLVITGSPSGEPQFKRDSNVKPGEYPGPVYPASLAKEQREAMGMIAGIWNSMSGKFGFEPTDVATQSGNASEYQLRDKRTKRLYWVTPMKPRSSDDQVLAAYSVIPADAATSGSLNKQSIYVLPDGDPRAVNLDDLEARTRQAISDTNPGFYSSGGELAEFLPLSGEKWQVYAQVSGRVVYRITVSTDSRIRPTVAKLDEVEESLPVQGPAKASACAEDLSLLSDVDLAKCLADLAAELNNREAEKSK